MTSASPSNELVNFIHSTCIRNKHIIQNSSLCGCFHCTEIFQPILILDWIDDGQTAVCPYCTVDSVIGDFKLDTSVSLDLKLLKALQSKYFKNKDPRLEL
jgi:hypothetical protein